MLVRVKDLVRKAVGEGELHLFNRQTGRHVKVEAAAILSGADTSEVVTFDFEGVGIIDFSSADEFLATLLDELIAGEYGEKYLRLIHLDSSQEENIGVALEKKRVATLLFNPDYTWRCLGRLKPYLRQTLDLVMNKGTISARQLSALCQLELNNSSTRLINLYRQRLVTREERPITEGGREFLYTSLRDASSRGGHPNA